MIDPADISIDPVFESLIPKLSQDEREQLIQNLKKDGFRDPLVVWLGHNILLDGHNRLDIWKTDFGSDVDHVPDVKELPFANREEAQGWVIRNQMGRRNLSAAARVELALKLKPALEARGFEVAVFHSTGMGGRAFEALAAQGRGIADLRHRAGPEALTQRVEALGGKLDRNRIPNVRAHLLFLQLSKGTAAPRSFPGMFASAQRRTSRRVPPRMHGRGGRSYGGGRCRSAVS